MYLALPGSLRTVMSSSPLRYSMMSVSVAEPAALGEAADDHAVDLDDEVER